MLLHYNTDTTEKLRQAISPLEADHFFAKMFETVPQVGLIVLPIDDWQAWTDAAFATYRTLPV